MKWNRMLIFIIPTNKKKHKEIRHHLPPYCTCIVVTTFLVLKAACRATQPRKWAWITITARLLNLMNKTFLHHLCKKKKNISSMKSSLICVYPINKNNFIETKHHLSFYSTCIVVIQFLVLIASCRATQRRKWVWITVTARVLDSRNKTFRHHLCKWIYQVNSFHT